MAMSAGPPKKPVPPVRTMPSGAPKEKQVLLAAGGGPLGMDLESYECEGYELVQVCGFYKVGTFGERVVHQSASSDSCVTSFVLCVARVTVAKSCRPRHHEESTLGTSFFVLIIRKCTN